MQGVRDTIKHLPELVPGYTTEQGYELVGMFWNQGLSDMTPEVAGEYETNMANLIKDLRKEFQAPEMKVVIGLTGNWGHQPEETLEKWGNDENDRRKFLDALHVVQKAQWDVAKRPEFADTVVTAETRHAWRPREEYGGRGTETHWMANGESYWLIGESMAQAMVNILNSSK